LKVFIGRSITVVVDAIALIGREPEFGLAAVQRRPVDAGEYPGGIAGWNPAGCGCGHVIFVRGVVAVIVDSIADIEGCSRSRYAAVIDGARVAARDSSRDAITLSAIGCLGLKVLIRGPIAVVVDKITGVLGLCRERGAGVHDEAIKACEQPCCITWCNSACRDGSNIVFVGIGVAIIVDAITVVGQCSLKRDTAVGKHTPNTARGSYGETKTLTAGRGHGLEVFVRGSVAVVVYVVTGV